MPVDQVLCRRSVASTNCFRQYSVDEVSFDKNLSTNNIVTTQTSWIYRQFLSSIGYSRDPRMHPLILSITMIMNSVSFLVNSLTFLTFCYVYQQNCKSLSGASLYDNYKSYTFFTYLPLVGEICGKQLHCSFDFKRFRTQIQDPVLKFFLLCDIEVYYDDYNELKRDKDLYQTFYRNIRFSYKSSSERISRKKNVSIQFNKDCIGKNNNQNLVSKHSRIELEYLPNSDLAHNSTLNEDHVERLISCSLCSERIERSEICQHYLNQTHQEYLINILLYFHSKNDQSKRFFLSRINETISSLEKDGIQIQNHLQQITCEYQSSLISLQRLGENFHLLELLNGERGNLLSRTTSAQHIHTEGIDYIRERLDGKEIPSFDGTLLWKINNIEQRLDDAKFERQRSIYSPEFYSSHFGYRMCARLFFNGINHRRQGYLSIYFLLKRGKYDALLEWPFSFKISFTLLDQATPMEEQNHLCKFFWSDQESTCFQRPRLEMNDAYGLEKFISLDQFRRNQHRYVQGDTVFIRIQVDFLNRTPDLVADEATVLIDDERHTDGIHDDLLGKCVAFVENSNANQGQ